MEAESKGYDEWVEAWRAAVRAAPAAVGLVELPSTQILELSPRALELLGPPAATGLDWVADRSNESQQVVDLVTAGALDTVVGRRQVRGADGSIFEVIVRARAIRSQAGSDLAICEIDDLAPIFTPTLTDELVVNDPEGFASQFHLARPVVGTLDGSWRIAHLTAGIENLLGYRAGDLIGKSIVKIIRPDDLPALLFALAEATSDEDATVITRFLRRDGTWRRVEVIVTMLAGEGSPFALVLAGIGEPGDSDRLEELEHRLGRIAVEIAEAGLAWRFGETDDPIDERMIAGLPRRQREVVSRLARGQRVPTIAREMYLSQSTVRNYLSAVFRKLGVGSQEELLARLRRPLDTPSN